MASYISKLLHGNSLCCYVRTAGKYRHLVNSDNQVDTGLHEWTALHYQ